MANDHCPLCKSKNLKFIDPVKSREKLKELLGKSDFEMLDTNIKELISKLDLDVDLTEEEKEFYEKHGRKVICMNCGFTFYEFDEYEDLEEKESIPVSFDEYEDYLREHCSNFEFIDFILDKSKDLNEYYIEVLDQLIKEYNELTQINSEIDAKDIYVN